ncbi:MAG: sialate O-acetylesterase [Chitinophagales bacterium]
MGSRLLKQEAPGQLSLPDVQAFFKAGNYSSGGKGRLHSKLKYLYYLRWDSLGALFKAAVDKTTKAITKTGIPLSGIIWSKGEADASFINALQSSEIEYKKQLKLLIKRFRFEFGSNTPFYIIQTGFANGENSNGFEQVQRVQEVICDEMPNTYLVYSFAKYFQEYGLMTDYIHYNQQGLNVIGKSVAEAIFQIENTNIYIPPMLEESVYPNPTKGTLSLQLINVSLHDQAKITFFDLTGHPAKTYNLPLREEIIETIELDVRDLSIGLYFIYSNINGHSAIQKIGIEN